MHGRGGFSCKMPCDVDLNGVIRSVIEHRVYENIYKADWKNEFEDSDKIRISLNYYPSKKDDVFEIVFANKIYKAMRLNVHNTSGWNYDARCRIEDDVTNFENYRDRIDLHKEITFGDFVDAIFAVKSGKKDAWYELFIKSTCRLVPINDNEIEIWISLIFDHGC